MPDETTDSEPTKEKKEQKIRDIPPKNDVKGGASEGKKDEKPPPRRTAEIDFMKYLKDVE